MNYTNQVFSGKLSLSPGERRNIKTLGTHIRILSSSSTTPILVGVGGPEWPMGAGQGMPVVQINEAGDVKLQMFREVSFYNYTSTEKIDIEFALSLGGLDDASANIRGSIQIDQSGPALETPAAVAVPIGGVTLQADARIKERIIQNNGEFPIWWGDENTDPATKKGFCIYAGSHGVINTWGAVTLKGDGGDSLISINNILKAT